MRARILHMMCAALLTVGPHLLLQSCSSAEQEDGDLAGEQNAEGNAEASNESNTATEEGSEAVNDTDTAESNGAEGNLANEGGEANAAPADSQVLEGDQTKSDLEDIIAGQNADASAAPAADAAPADAAPAEATPADATAAATPAEAAPAAATPAPAMAAGPALPEQGSKMPYIVRVGETLSSIAKTIYGSTEKWTEMAELSSIKNPNLVRPGDVVYYQLAQETLAFATAYEGAGRTELTVQAGDTLAGIAQRVYGNQGDWKYVWRQNANIENPDRLEVGMTIYYLSPGSLQAALDYARSVTLAELLKSFQQPSNQNVKTDAQAPAQASTTNHATSVTGFELATSMFQVFTTNFATAG